MLRADYIPVVNVKGVAVLDWLDSGYTQLFRQGFSYVSHMIGQDEEFAPDLISYNAYGATEYWWIIMQFNSIQFPLTQLQAGTIINIPDLNQVIEFLTANNPNSPSTTQTVISV